MSNQEKPVLHLIPLDVYKKQQRGKWFSRIRSLLFWGVILFVAYLFLSGGMSGINWGKLLLSAFIFLIALGLIINFLHKYWKSLVMLAIIIFLTWLFK